MKRCSAVLAVLAAGFVLLGVAVPTFAQDSADVTHNVRIVFNNGSEMKFQVDANTFRALSSGNNMLNQLMVTPVWTLALQDRTYFIPTANILYIECTPPMGNTLNTTIRARLVEAPAK